MKPCTVWLTGLSGAGKSTLAREVERRLRAANRLVTVLDGDLLRQGLCKDLGLDPASRAENVRRAAEVARLFNQAGLIVIAAFVSPYEADRANAREIIGEDAFRLVHLATPLAACRARDPKGLYARHAQGTLTGLTGVDAPYEAPPAPALALDTSALDLAEAAERVLALV